MTRRSWISRILGGFLSLFVGKGATGDKEVSFGDRYPHWRNWTGSYKDVDKEELRLRLVEALRKAEEQKLFNPPISEEEAM